MRLTSERARARAFAGAWARASAWAWAWASAVIAVAGGAQAQERGGERPPWIAARDAPAPGAGPRVGVEAQAAWLGAEGLSGGQGALAVRGGWAIEPDHESRWSLDATAGLDLRAGYLAAQNSGAGRVGLGALALGAGAGVRLGDLQLGARLGGELAPRAFGFDAVDAGAAAWAVRVAVLAAAIAPPVEAIARIDYGFASYEHGVVSWMAAAHLDAAFGDASTVVRPLGGLSLLIAQDSWLAARARAGALFTLASARRLALSATLEAALPSDPEGLRLAANVALLYAPGSLKRGRHL